MNSDDVSDSNQTGNDGKAESEGNKTKEKKYRNAPPTKVVIRRLPPSMTLEKFIDQVSPLPENDYLHFAKADASLGQNAFCTAYVNFVQPKDVFIFKEKFDDYIFIDSKGNEFPAVVEFAPFQKIPRKKSRQRDPKCGTIDTDTDYLAFVTQVKQSQEDIAEGGVKSTCGKSSPLLSVQDVLEEIEAKERERKSRKATTPLIEYIKLRKLERQRMKDEKKEERKRREVERKRAKEEERKHRREANREAIQNKRERERKEQRKEASARHDDRISVKHDSGHGAKNFPENQLSSGDIVKQKKESDNHYDDADEDDDDEGIDDEDDDVEPEMYDQEQTQKLKEILRIGIVCKGTEKSVHHESTPEALEVIPQKKGGIEKGSGSGGRGGGDWERSNRGQRMGGSYNEEYQGARPKTNRSDSGCQERRGPCKEKKQNDSRQYGERHNQKPGKMWLAKNEARNQKLSEDRIKIQKADGDKGGLGNEFSNDKNSSHGKGDDTIDAEARSASSASDGPAQGSSLVTTPCSENEEPGGGVSSEEKGGKEIDQLEKAAPDTESKQGGRDKNSSGSKGSRDSASGSSSSHNTSNGEVRRMRNKVGTSRDSGSLKMIKNKDRPSIEIYRPGMRRFNLQKKDAENGSNGKGQGNTSTGSNNDSASESTCTSSGYSTTHNTAGNLKGKERDDKRRVGGGRGGGNKRRDGSWKQSDESGNIRHDARHKGREDRGRGGWAGQNEGAKTSTEGSARERYDDKISKEELVEVRSMTFKRSVSRD